MKERGVHNTAGFSLVELMVVTTIFGIILGGVLKVYEVSNRTYLLQEQLADLQQNIRVAKMFIERDARMAACGIGTSFALNGGRIYAVENINGGAGASDRLTVRYIDYEPSTDPVPCDGLLPQLTLGANIVVNATTSTVSEDLTALPFSDWNGPKDCEGVAHGTGDFMAVIADPTGTPAEIVTVTGVNTGTRQLTHSALSFPHVAGSTVDFFQEDDLKQIEYALINGNLMRLVTRVDPPGTGPSAAEQQTLVENIEDFQLAFGLDTLPALPLPVGDGAWTGNWDDGLWNVAVPAGGLEPKFNNTTLTVAQRNQVHWVRTTILGLSASEDRNYSNSRPAVEDHLAADPVAENDGFRRKQVSFTVRVRNL